MRRRRIRARVSNAAGVLTGWSGNLGLAMPVVSFALSRLTEHLGKITSIPLISIRAKPSLGSFRLKSAHAHALAHHSACNEPLEFVRI